MSDLNDILSDEPIIEETEDVLEETTEEPQAEQDEEPVVEEPAPAPEPEPQTVPLAALQETRAENKELKATLAGLQQQVAQMQQPEQQPQTPDFVDPEGAQFFQHQMGQMQAHFVAELSEAKARLKFGSDEIDQAFEAAQEAGIIDQFKGQNDPWGALGKWHSGVLEQKKAQDLLNEIGGDVEAYKAKIRAEITAELQANQVAESVTQAAQKTAPSLASEPNLGSRTAPAWSGPTSLNDILSG